jgi:hypothetical protein
MRSGAGSCSAPDVPGAVKGGSLAGFLALAALLGPRTGTGYSTVTYSTVTDFARLRGWSTSFPMKTAVW